MSLYTVLRTSVLNSDIRAQKLAIQLTHYPLCSPIFVYKCQYYFFCYCLLPFTRGRQIKPDNFSNALIHCRDCTHPIVQSSILREARAFDTMGDLERTLCWMTCFQHGSLISSRVIGISQGILCTLTVVAVFFLPSFATRYFPLSECLLVSMPLSVSK